MRSDTFPAPQTLVSFQGTPPSTSLTLHLDGSLSGEGGILGIAVLVSISGLHLLSISGIYPPVVTMTGVPRPSLQELLPDELMHMVQRDLLPPGLG